MSSEQGVVRRAERRSSDRDYDNFHEETPVIKRDSRGSIFVGERSIRCIAEHCTRPGVCVLELQPFCIHHFITCCFERLRLCSVSWCLNPQSKATESYDSFIRECIMRTANLLQEGAHVDPVRRSHLLDVFLWASELAIKRNSSR